MTDFWGGHPDAIAAAGPQAATNMIFAAVDTRGVHFREALKAASPKASITAITFCCYSAAALALRICSDGLCLTPEVFAKRLTSTSQVILPDDNLSVVGREVIYPVTLKRVENGVISEVIRFLK